MKQELVQLAKDKGFVTGISYNMPENSLGWLFWMTELQKWLRDKHDIHIRMQMWLPDESNRFDADIISNLVDVEEESNNEFLVYEDALEEGLFEALKLLKDIE